MSYQTNYDTHTLFVKCDNATVNQIRKVFHDAIANYQKKIGKTIDCKYRVNLLVDKEGKSYGTAFVFITNPKVYYMIIGKNPDGTDRIEYVDDPSWEPPVVEEGANTSGWSSIEKKPKKEFTMPEIGEDLLNLNWEDLCDSDDEDDYPDPQVPLKVAFQLPPLIQLPPYILNEEQLKEKRMKIIDENTGKANFDPEKVNVSNEAYLCVDRAIITPLDSKYMPNILKAKNIPSWISKEDLKAQFAPYASDNTTFQRRTIKGVKFEEPYPFVNINPSERIAFVIFDPSTNDAQFALHMMKKLLMSKKKRDGTIVSQTLIFGHSFLKDRDVMTHISQQPRTTPNKRSDRRPNSRRR